MKLLIKTRNIMNLPLQDHVQSLLNKIDDGKIFETIIVSLLKLLSFLFLLGGVLFTVLGMFGDSGFFMSLFTPDFNVIWKITGVLGFLIGFAATLAVTYFSFMVIWKRAVQLGEKEYTGLLEYLYMKVAPTLIVTVGEVASIMLLAYGLLSLIGELIGSVVYFPLMQIVEGPVMVGSIGYDYFVEMLVAGPVMGIVGAVLVLVGTYIALEVYAFACRLVRVWIKWLPKFAIPIAIRRREIPGDQKFMEDQK